MNQLTISKISMINFRNHKELEVNLNNLNVLIGENGGGKTSILEAICYALFGAVASGAKKNELITHGEKTGGVTLTLSNDYKIVRDFSTGIKLIDNNNKIISEKVAEIESYFNIDKNIFMNILYASQNDVYSYFLKFNAKEKDFIDSMFNLDNLTDNIITSLKNIVNQLDVEYNNITNEYNNKKNLENTIDSLLTMNGINSITQLKNSIDVAKSNLDSIDDKRKLYREKTNYSAQYNILNKELEKLKSQLNNESINYNTNMQTIQSHKDSMNNYIDDCSKKLNVNIDINNIDSLYEMFDKNCDIKTHLFNIQSYVKQGLSDLSNTNNINSCFTSIYNIVNIIYQIDEYRKYYDNIKNNINNYRNNIGIIKLQVNNSKNVIDNITNQINNYTNQLEVLKQEIDTIDLSSIGDIDTFANLIHTQQEQYTKLNTILQSIKLYQSQLNNMKDIDISILNRINYVKTSITNIIPIFNRDGFISYLRKSLLKEIAINIGESLEKFGFTKLIPTSIDEKNGALLFHNRPFRSLSGGEKTIAAILLRILYAKLLAPSMRLNILMLDEPTADLDSVRVGYLKELLYKINTMLNMQIIIVTHDEQVIPENANIININTNFG